MGLQAAGQLDIADLALQCLLHFLQHILAGFLFLFQFFLFLFGFQIQIAVQNRLELFVLIVLHHADCKLVHILGEVQDLIALVLDLFGLRQGLDTCNAFAGCIVDLVLSLRHTVYVFLQRHQLAVL